METLNGLIQKIKEDGVLEAHHESKKIVEHAQKEAGAIIGKAKKDAETMLASAKQEAEQFKTSSENALRQSARNIVLGVQNEIVDVFKTVLREKVEGALSDDVLKEIIVKCIDSWLKQGKENSLEVLVNAKDRDKLEKYVVASLSAKLAQGVDIKPVAGIKKGFLIGTKNSNVHYDVTETGIADMLAEYLNPRLKEILRGK